MSYYASAYVRLITGLSIRDTTAGFMCYRAQVLKEIELDKVKFTGYAFQIEMKYTATKMGFKLPRPYGIAGFIYAHGQNMEFTGLEVGIDVMKWLVWTIFLPLMNPKLSNRPICL